MLELEFFDSDIVKGEQIEFWSILREGEPIGNIQLVDQGNILFVAHVDDTVGRNKDLPLGPSGVREVLRLLKKEFPQATQITGRRVTGVRTGRPEVVVRDI